MGRSSVVLALGLAACKRDDADTDGGAPRLDGWLLVDNGTGRMLLDEATGETSTGQLPGPFSVAAGLDRIVHQLDPWTVAVSEVVVDDAGLPGFEVGPTVASSGSVGFNDADVSPPAFNAQGDRVVAGGGWADQVWWDPATNRVAPAGVPSPDGRHHADGGVVYDDFAAVMPAPATSSDARFTADGQWLVVPGSIALGDLTIHLTHVPSRAQLVQAIPLPAEGEYAVPFAFPDPTGLLLFAALGGNQGEVIGEFGPEPSTAPLLPFVRLDPRAIAQDVPAVVDRTSLGPVDELPLAAGAVGYTWTLVGTSPDGRRAYVQRRDYEIRQLPEISPPAYEYVYLDFDLLLFELGSGYSKVVAHVDPTDGDADEGNLADRLVAGGCLAADSGGPAPFGFAGRWSPHLQWVSEERALCGTADGGGLLFDPDDARLTQAEWPALDGETLVRWGDDVDDGICQETLEGELVGCVPFAWPKFPVAQVGLGLSERVSTGPIVVATSHRAAVPGTAVHVLGYGFGTDGTLTIGDVAVPPNAVTSWTDARITFTMPANAPEVGPVRVETDDGRSAKAAVWLARAAAWSGAPEVPFAAHALHQGINRLAFPGAGAWDAVIVGSQSFAALADDPGPDHLDVYVPQTPPEAPWLAFRDAGTQVFRPYASTPGLPDDPDAPWQPIADVGAAAGDRFQWSAGAFHLRSASGVGSAVLLEGSTSVDWRLTGFANPQWGLGTYECAFYDGSLCLGRTGSTVRALTGWTRLDADVHAPQWEERFTAPFASVSDVGVFGDVAVVLEQTGSSPVTRALHTSTDGGQTWTEAVPSTVGLWVDWSAALGGARSGIYGAWSSMPTEGPWEFLLARVTPTGALEVDPAVPSSPVFGLPCTDGYRPALDHLLLCQLPGTSQVFALDVTGDRAWTELGGAYAGHLRSVYVDEPRGRILLGTDAGEILASPDGVDFAPIEELTYGPIAMSLSVEAVGALADGRLVAAALRSDGATRYLVGPPP